MATPISWTAFLRIDRKSSGEYLCIAESYRNKQGKNRHRILHQLGKVSDYTPEQLQRIGSRLYELGGGSIRDLLGPDIQEMARYNYGYFQVYNKICSHYVLSAFFNRIAKTHKLQFDLNNAFMLMLLERLSDPCSKLASYFHQEDYLGLQPVQLQHLYRTLDKLADYSEQIQQYIFQTGRNLFNSKLDVVFYDVTTLYFESDVQKEGSLRQLGFGKDGKIGKTQILKKSLRHFLSRSCHR